MTGIDPLIGWVLVGAGTLGLLVALVVFAVSVGRAIARADREEPDDER